jgi:hypothetical protein
MSQSQLVLDYPPPSQTKYLDKQFCKGAKIITACLHKGTIHPVISRIMVDAANYPEEYVKNYKAGRGGE